MAARSLLSHMYHSFPLLSPPPFDPSRDQAQNREIEKKEGKNCFLCENLVLKLERVPWHLLAPLQTNIIESSKTQNKVTASTALLSISTNIKLHQFFYPVQEDQRGKRKGRKGGGGGGGGWRGERGKMWREKERMEDRRGTKRKKFTGWDGLVGWNLYNPMGRRSPLLKRVKWWGK